MSEIDKCEGCPFMAIALNRLDNIQTTQGLHTQKLILIESGINTHLSSVSKDTGKMATNLESIAKTNSDLVKAQRWSIPILGFIMVVATLGAVIVFEKMGDGGKAKFSGAGVELERGSKGP